MDILDNLFRFPIVMVDGDLEMRKERKRNMDMDDAILYKIKGEQDEEVDLLIGEAECPYYDFISILDRWVPTQTSREDAKNGKYSHCYVIFGNSGSFLVPWPKKRFKDEYRKFADKRLTAVAEQKRVVISLPKEDVRKMIQSFDQSDLEELYEGEQGED